MIAAWMLYLLVVGVLLAGAARLLEGALRARRAPLRGVWLGAMVGTIALAVVSVRRPAGAPSQLRLPGAVVDAGAAAEAAGSPGWAAAAARLSGVVDRALELAAGPLAAAPGWSGRAAALAWLALSAGLLLLFGRAVLQLLRARRHWRVAEVGGVAVRVAPDTGPLVAGLLRPEIVVPEWLLRAPVEQRALVLAHEREHLRARDPAVLAAGCLAVALLPWHPAAWWMLRRLRLAVELDCDARVLRAGANRRSYGSVLLQVADRRAGGLAGALALLESPAQLERRLIAMTEKSPRFAPLRAGGLAALAGLLVLAACEASMPSAPEIQRMDVASAERGMQRIGLGTDANATYWLDGKRISAEEARALKPEQIATIEVRKEKAEGGDTQEVRIYTPAGLAAAGSPAPASQPARRILMAGDSTIAGGFDGLLIVDGRVEPASRLATLSPELIAEVRVLKGPAATQQYADPRAANGVIQITTKAAAKRQ